MLEGCKISLIVAHTWRGRVCPHYVFGLFPHLLLWVPREDRGFRWLLFGSIPLDDRGYFYPRIFTHYESVAVGWQDTSKHVDCAWQPSPSDCLCTIRHNSYYHSFLRVKSILKLGICIFCDHTLSHHHHHYHTSSKSVIIIILSKLQFCTPGKQRSK